MSNNEEPLYYEDIAEEAKSAVDRIHEREQRGHENTDLFKIEERMAELRDKTLSPEEEAEVAELRKQYDAELLRNLNDKKH